LIIFLATLFFAGSTQKVLAEVTRLHPYEVPALLVLPTEGGSADYCDWILRETGDGPRS
jgi:periplasmic divalent cation tolerance protein